MKKSIILLASIAAIAAGCAKEQPASPENGKIQVTFAAETENAKSALDGKAISWATKDVIAVWDGTGKNEFVYSSKSEFTGTVTANQSGTYYVVYPYYYVLKDKNGNENVVGQEFVAGDDPEMKVWTTIPSCQIATANSFAPFANLSACKATLVDSKLCGTMTNLCGYLKFTVTDAATTPIKKIRFESVDAAKRMSGVGYVQFTDTEITATGVDAFYVDCVPSDRKNFSNGTYYLAVYPNYYRSGIKITMIGTDGSVYETTTNSFTLARNAVANFGEITSDLSSKKTEKFAVIADFYNDGEAFSKPTTETEFTMTQNSIKYSFSTTSNNTSKASGPYKAKTDNQYLTFTQGQLGTPALEDKTLKEINIVWKSHNTNYRGKFIVSTTNANNDTSNSLTGRYWLRNQTDFTSNDTYFFISNAGSTKMTALFYSHKFTLGKKSANETSLGSSVTLSEPEAGERYYISNGDSNASLVDHIELIYE